MDDIKKIKALGLMSGTSLDGLDIVAVEFQFNHDKWTFNIIAAQTLAYNKQWLKTLKHAPLTKAEKLIQTHSDFGRFIGKEINKFNKKHTFHPDLIASHGHTVFHQPEKGFTLQIGKGAEIAALTGIKTICDFRSLDIALGGQGAPLVPIGDQVLFSNFEYCLNLGGFSNISYEQNGKRIAFDICPVNTILNHFAAKQGMLFDTNGELGRKGKINTDLLNKLNAIHYYHISPPKSLGREWMESDFFPILKDQEITDIDKLRTIYEHIAIQIAKTGTKGKLLVTGGGALNSFLMALIKHHSPLEIVIPENNIIHFKEALIFAFLGVLKDLGKNNCLSSVTGAKHDCSSGVIYNM